MFKVILVLFIIVILSGCANKPVVDLNTVKNIDKRVTIIDDTRTKESARYVIEDWLDKNGYVYEVKKAASNIPVSGVSIEYSANWWWDIIAYMRYLDITVNQDNKPIGNVKIDTVLCGGSDKFGSADERIRLTLDLLFEKVSKEEASELICLGK